jgi:hypothetical protein
MTKLDDLIDQVVPTSVLALSGYERGFTFPHIHNLGQMAERSRLGIMSCIPRNQNRAPPTSPEAQIRYCMGYIHEVLSL